MATQTVTREHVAQTARQTHILLTALDPAGLTPAEHEAVREAAHHLGAVVARIRDQRADEPGTLDLI